MPQNTKSEAPKTHGTPAAQPAGYRNCLIHTLPHRETYPHRYRADKVIGSLTICPLNHTTTIKKLTDKPEDHISQSIC